MVVGRINDHIQSIVEVALAPPGCRQATDREMLRFCTHNPITSSQMDQDQVATAHYRWDVAYW